MNTLEENTERTIKYTKQIEVIDNNILSFGLQSEHSALRQANKVILIIDTIGMEVTNE